MHLGKILERWVAPEAPLQRRQQTTTKGSSLPTNIDSAVSSIVDTVTQTQKQQTTTQQPQTTQQPDTTTQQPQTTSKAPETTSTPPPQTTQKPSTTAAPSSTSVNKSTTTVPNKSTLDPVTTIVTPSAAPDPSSTGDASAPSSSTGPEQVSSPSSKPTNAANSDGGFEGAKGSEIARGVGIAAGVLIGFAVLVLGVYFWRRHQRRQNMERIGSMEELARPPSPGPLGLGRSLTRGNTVRQPIDDDDDDFLTPMDTLPNTHRMDDYGAKGPDTATFFSDEKSTYAPSIYQETEYGDPPVEDPTLPPNFPVAPPAAVTAANGRYYSGDFSSMRPKTPQSSGGNGAAIPQYSAMNKYTAFTPGAAVTTPFTSSERTPVYNQSGNPPSYNNRQSLGRPGGGYRSYDAPDAGGYV